MKKAYSIVICLLFASQIQTQIPIWRDINLEDDINIHSLETDTLGFIWGLSDAGLYQYDGLKLSLKKSFRKKESKLTALSQDSQNNFLIGTNTGQIIQFNPYLNHTISTDSTLLSTPITYMDCNDRFNQCLTISYGHGLIWSTSDMDTLLTTDNLLISNEVYSGLLYSNQIILATDQGIQFLTIDGSAITTKTINKNDGLGDVIISDITHHKNEIIACNYDSEIYIIDKSSYEITTLKLPFRQKINGLKVLNNGDIGVFTNMGIYVFEEGKWIKKYPVDRTEEVLDITIDEENNLWACRKGNRLSKANLNFQITSNTIDKAQAIIKNKDMFWIGSSEGLYLVDGLSKTKILDNNITCLQKLDDDILVGTYSAGIIILDANGRIKGQIDGWENTPNQSVLYLYPKDEYLYISSLTGVSRLRLDRNEQEYKIAEAETLNDQLGPGYVYQILEDDGVYYFATDHQGLKILRKDSLQHITHFPNGNTMGSIYSMTKCDAGRIWFSSSTGYIGYEKDGIVNAMDNERLLQDPYTSLITSSDQRIIMARNSSIDIYDPATDHYLFHSEIKQEEEEELYLNCFTQEDNITYLAAPNAIIRIDEFQEAKMYPECLITDVMVNLVDMDNTRIFSEDQNNLEFKYAAAWMTDPERITYRYMLEGFEDNWRSSRDQRAIYPMLRPGKYTFRVEASIDGKFHHQSDNGYSFQIKQAFYKTWWFIGLVGILILVIFRQWRDERLKVRQQREDLNKKRIEAQLISLQTQLNPHFLFNSFNTLIGLIEENPTKGVTFTEKLTDFYRTILELGKNDLISLSEELDLLDTYIHLIKERFGDQLHINRIIGDIQGYKIPPLTLQLLIENAVKHNVVSTKHPLHVLIRQHEDTITITNKKKAKYGTSKGTGIGLENIKKRHTLNNLKPPKIEQDDTHFNVTIYLNKEE